MILQQQRSRIVIGLTIAAVVFIADQLSKAYIFSLLAQHPRHMLSVFSFLDLVQVWNTGISFGMFNGYLYGPIILTIIALGITIVLGVLMFRSDQWLSILALSLVIGGALGNITDRLRFGAVADFIYFHIGEYYWPAFNIADAAVCIGVAILLYESVSIGSKKTN